MGYEVANQTHASESHNCTLGIGRRQGEIFRSSTNFLHLAVIDTLAITVQGNEVVDALIAGTAESRRCVPYFSLFTLHSVQMQVDVAQRSVEIL